MADQRDPRTVQIWAAPDLSGRLMKRRWGDGMPASYGAQVWSSGGWRWAESNEEYRRVLIAVARWLDQQARDRETEKDDARE